MAFPAAWVARMRESMAQLTPHFSANRTVREYTEQHYLPAAATYRARAADNGAVGRQVVDWQHALEQKWAMLHFGEVKVETAESSMCLKFRSISVTSIRIRCESSFMPTESTATARFGRR